VEAEQQQHDAFEREHAERIHAPVIPDWCLWKTQQLADRDALLNATILICWSN